MNDSYRAAPSSYLVLVGLLSVPALLWLIVFLRNPSTGWEGLVVALILPVSFGIWLSCFHLSFSESAVTYRSLFGGSHVAAYSDIQSVGTSRVAPISGMPLGISVRLRNGTEFMVNAKPFSREAVKKLTQLSESNKPLKNDARENARAS